MRRLLSTTLALGLILLHPAPAGSQEDMRLIAPGDFPSPRRAPALFPHDAHNAAAGLADCAACHHGGRDGRLDPAQSSEGQPCAACHPPAAAPDKTPLRRAFHRLCVGCHERLGKGPATCGACHAGTADDAPAR